MKKALALLLAVLTVAVLAFSVSATTVGDLPNPGTSSSSGTGWFGPTGPTSGQCGENNTINWTRDAAGNVTFEGNGVIDYLPWEFAEINEITSITIGEGILGFTDNYIGACAGMENLTTLSLPGSMVEVPPQMFARCTSLKNVTLGEGIVVLRGGCFADCTALTELELPSTLESIDVNALRNTSISTLVLPDGMKFLGEYALLDTKLTEITLPDSAWDNIQSYAVGFRSENGYPAKVENFKFNYSGSDPMVLDYIKMWDAYAMSGECGAEGSSVQWSFNPDTGTLTISGTGEMAPPNKDDPPPMHPWEQFQDQITKVVVGPGITKIADEAFAWFYTNLEEIEIQNPNTRPGVMSFEDTPWLAKQGDFVVIGGVLYAYQGPGGDVVIPSTVTEIGENAFCYRNENNVIEFEPDNTSITSITIPNSVTKIGMQAFWSCTGLTRLDIPSSVTEIDYLAFAWCANLKEVTVPGTVKKILWNTFGELESLNSVTLEEGVEIIEDCAFASPSLKKITIPKSVTTIGECSFGYVGTWISDTEEKWEKVPGYTIAGYAGSAAERYAKENGFTFADLTPQVVDPQPSTSAEAKPIPTNYRLEGATLDDTAEDAAPEVVAKREALSTAIAEDPVIVEAFEGKTVYYSDIKLITPENTEDHSTEVTVLLSYPTSEIAANWQDYNYAVVHLKEDVAGVYDPANAELVTVTPTADGLEYTGTLSAFGIAVAEKPAAWPSAPSRPIYPGPSGGTWNPGTQGTASQNNPLATPTGADDVAGAVVLLGAAAAVIGVGAVRAKRSNRKK